MWVNLKTAKEIGFSTSSLIDTCKEFADKLKEEGGKVEIKIVGE